MASAGTGRGAVTTLLGLLVLQLVAAQDLGTADTRLKNLLAKHGITTQQDVISTRTSAPEASHCTTPNGQQGLCVTVRECPLYVAVLQGDISDSLKNFLVKSLCVVLSEPLLCCPVQSVHRAPSSVGHKEQEVSASLPVPQQPSEGSPHQLKPLNTLPQRPNGRRPTLEDSEEDRSSDQTTQLFSSTPSRQSQNPHQLQPAPPQLPFFQSASSLQPAPPLQPSLPVSSSQQPFLQPAPPQLQPAPPQLQPVPPQLPSFQTNVPQAPSLQSTASQIPFLKPVPPSLAHLQPIPPEIQADSVPGDSSPVAPPASEVAPGAVVYDRVPEQPETTLPPPTTAVPHILPSESECGLASPAQGSAWPWLAALGRFHGSVFHESCGAVLISRAHLLAAAHCLLDRRIPTPSHVRLGTSGPSSASADHYEIQTFISPGYNTTTYENDLALVTLRRSAVFSAVIQPVCLPFRFGFDGFRYQEMLAVGWSKAADASQILGLGSYRSDRTVTEQELKVVGSDQCRATFLPDVPSVVIDRRQMCAASSSSASCQSDNGAPLLYLDDFTTNRTFVVGVTSYGYGCKDPLKPSVFTRVGAFLDWIEENLQRSEEDSANDQQQQQPVFVGFG